MLLTERRRPVAIRAAVPGLFAAIFAVHAVIALVVGAKGWDDGSITAAFARTFADTGRIAMTPPSEIVEGYSSPFWMLLLAATYYVLPLGFGGLLLASQLWAAFFAALGATFLYSLVRPFLGSAALPLTFVVFASFGFLNETANGMEMTALSAATLAMVWALRRRDRLPLVIAVAALTPWIRLEAAGYVVAGAMVMALVSRDRRRAAYLIGAVLLSVAVLTALRLAIFDSVIPNTMYAKQSAPYPYAKTFAARLAGAKTVTKELLYVLAPGAILILGAVLGRATKHVRAPGLWSRSRAGTVTPVLGYAAGYLVGVGGANLFLGPNWGYLGRMEQSVIALGVVTAVYCFPRAVRSLRRPVRLTAVVAALLLLSAYGVDRERVEALTTTNDDVTTPAAFRQTAEAAEKVRQALDVDTLSLMTPDVGGASLCCVDLRILDSGLLANRELARSGYGALADYLSAHRPDVIVTHSVWSQASRLYELPAFRQNYTPIAVDDMWFYLRDDLTDRIADRCTATPIDATKPFRYRGSDVDEAYIRTLGSTDVCALR